jgi:calnexin
MRFAIGATVALAAAVVRADDASSSEAESSTLTSVAKPTFTVYLANGSSVRPPLTVL